MAKTRPHLKFKIPENETVFYVFQLSPSEYMLYDSAMGDPIEHGSLNKVSGKLAMHCETLEKKYENVKIAVWKFQRDLLKGWKLIDRMNGIAYDTPSKNARGAFEVMTPRSPLKDIGTDFMYYWMDLGKMHYLYDSDMGSPVWFGSNSKIAAAVSVHAKKYAFGIQMFHFPAKSPEPRWKMSLRYKITAEAEKGVLENKKEKEDTPNKK